MCIHVYDHKSDHEVKAGGLLLYNRGHECASGTFRPLPSADQNIEKFRTLRRQMANNFLRYIPPPQKKKNAGK